MSVAIVTGSAGLIGSEAVKFFSAKGMDVVGIDNNMRKEFFGNDACTHWNLNLLQKSVKNYTHFSCDIRNQSTLETIFKQYGKSISVIIHCAAQPSHDWAALQPHTDFTVNANGTLNLLELTRQYAFDASFIFLSTNKVYGDTPNYLPLEELDTRWEISPNHPYFGVGIDETMSIDHNKHSLFGVSKAAADLMVQEYGRYFGMKTACFRGGCLTGPAHSGTKLHGFLSYLMRCNITHTPYTVFGYKGKQVRDNIHSYDLVNALWHFSQAPKVGAVYNMGGGPPNNCSILEAINLCQLITKQEIIWSYDENNRIGDHIWWVSDVRKFKQDYPTWDFKYDITKMLIEIYAAHHAAQCYGVGSKASRLVSCDQHQVKTLESLIAKDKGTQSALIFNSGFQANISVISALLDPNVLGTVPLVFSDRLNHASMHAGCQLAKVKQQRFNHLDYEHLAHLLKQKAHSKQPKFILTESVFGMDGDVADLEQIILLAKQYQAFIYVDEAHATGLFGKEGYGLTSDYANNIALCMGTFSKGLGGSGAYVACNKALKRYLVNRCQGFVFSTAPSPMQVAVMQGAWELIPSLQQEVKALFERATQLRKELQHLGFNTGNSSTHIIPIILEDPVITMKAQLWLSQQGIRVSAIRPPSVPPQQSRLRIALNLQHTQPAIDSLLDALQSFPH